MPVLLNYFFSIEEPPKLSTLASKKPHILKSTRMSYEFVLRVKTDSGFPYKNYGASVTASTQNFVFA